METLRKHRFAGFLTWLAQRMAETSRRQMVEIANLLKQDIESTRGFPPLEDPAILLARHDRVQR